MNLVIGTIRTSALCVSAVGRGGRILLAIAGTLLTFTMPLRAQVAASGGPQRATRGELQALLGDLERKIPSAKDGKTRLRLQLSAVAVKARLEQGDFKTGDRFVVAMSREGAPAFDTAQVRDSLLVLVAGLPELRVSGVLRSELDQTLQAHVSRYFKNVTARATILTRVLVSGPVGRAGFYYAAPDRPVADLIMLAGGPGVGANLNSLRVVRGNLEVVSSKTGKRAVKDGQTLEQLDIQSGDEVIVGTARRVNWGFVIQIFFIVSSLVFAAVNFLQWYYDRQER